MARDEFLFLRCEICGVMTPLDFEDYFSIDRGYVVIDGHADADGWFLKDGKVACPKHGDDE